MKNNRMILNKLKQKVGQVSSFRSVLVLFIVTHSVLVLMMLFTFPVIQADIGQQPFDLRAFGYTVDDAQSIVSTMSPGVKRLYIFPQILVLDVLYPFLLALLLSALMYRLSSLINRIEKLNAWLLVVPFMAMLFDYAENAFVLGMLTGRLSITQSVVTATSWFTQLKGAVTMLCWFVVIAFVVRFVIYRTRQSARA